MNPAPKLAAPYLGVAILCSAFSAGALQGQGAAAAVGAVATTPNATVKTDALTVYSDMRTWSAVLSTLKKGDLVIVEFEFKTSAERWCSVKLASRRVRLGYVQCTGLERKPEPVRVRDAGTRSGTITDLALATPVQPLAQGYDEIANLVVYDGSIDVTKLAELEAAAQSGTMATVRRAALAHYAAGNFELSRNSNDEAIEQYRAALPFAEKHPDLLAATLVRLAVVHLHRSEYSAALEYLDRARGVVPNSLAVARLSGWAYYGLDRLDEAVAQWKIAQQIEPDADVEKLLAKATTDLQAESGFRNGQTSHFTLHYEGSATPQLAAEILRALEEDFRAIQGQLRFAPQEPVAVVLYTQQDFRDITRAPSWAGAWNDGRIRVPVQGVSSVSDTLSRILRHELTHSFVRQKTFGHCPQWLHEGLAQWMEGRRTGDAARALVAAYDRRQYPPLKAIEGSWADFSATQAWMAYAWSLASVEYIVANSGMWGVERLLNELASGVAIEPALGSALQTNYQDIERETADFLRRTYVR
jgi:tetratricopeptide (TPR) repeat protein